jgi:CheY-like chemotaxis protein
LAALEELRCQPNQFDLVFTDYMMPQLNGIELAALIAQVRADLPIILMTGTVGAAKAPNGQPPAVAAILSKPFDLTDLSHAAAKALAAAH